MSVPEPLDEFAAGGVVETRGGDNPGDYIGTASDGTVFRFTPPSDYDQLELPFDEDDE